MEKKLHLVSLGCTKNLVDSEVMLGRLKEYTITDEAENADVIIVNTCGFIDAAKEESLQTIFSLHEQRKEESLLVMSGCLSERYKAQLQEELTEVDIFTGVGDYDKIDELLAKKQSRFSPKTYLLTNEERVITGSTSHAYIKLSEGCNQKCSFCAIPLFKGKLQSRSLENIIQEVKSLVEKGFYDFSFISQDSSSYLRDFQQNEGLIALIEAVEKIEGVKSARILYLYPTTTSDTLIDRIIESNVFHNYFDMPIQHISNSMLKIMKRGASKETIVNQLTKMRHAPDAFLRTGVIIGHPGEREEDFKELCDFFESFDFDRVSVFAYSDEDDTKSATMKDKVDKETINRRIETFNQIVEAKTAKSLQKEVGKTIDIITQGTSSEHDYFIGAKKACWAEEIDGEILINDSAIKDVTFGKMYQAKITEAAGENLIGTIIDPAST